MLPELNAPEAATCTEPCSPLAGDMRFREWGVNERVFNEFLTVFGVFFDNFPMAAPIAPGIS
jgi:hypothetical protein